MVSSDGVYRFSSGEYSGGTGSRQEVIKRQHGKYSEEGHGTRSRGTCPHLLLLDSAKWRGEKSSHSSAMVPQSPRVGSKVAFRCGLEPSF
uniref:ORF7 n=1 Tax=Fowl adenovirus C serotype 10 (strain SA2) TaxID=10547 RepID=Q9Q9G1_ADEGX|nr:ORF7 [Fowl aviadenovirus 10]